MCFTRILSKENGGPNYDHNHGKAERKVLRLRGGCCTDSAVFAVSFSSPILCLSMFIIRDQDRKYGEYCKKIRNRDDTQVDGTVHKHRHRAGGRNGAIAGAVAGGGGGGGGGGAGGC
ncbi:uncharacterized protein L199_003923 [Kwoniella botswanensis]|uniref:uncharacterized protein n=1 Tax=Kwoniella botswanensis TaxID=1268659 RepID=UPI00315CAE03